VDRLRHPYDFVYRPRLEAQTPIQHYQRVLIDQLLRKLALQLRAAVVHRAADTVATALIADRGLEDHLVATGLQSQRVDAHGAGEPGDLAPPPEIPELDPALAEALRSLSRLEREALLLVAWEDLTPGQAAQALGVSPVAFRVRLLRARRRFRASLEEAQAAPPSPHLNHLDVEGT